jgi:hypothetical protein
MLPIKDNGMAPRANHSDDVPGLLDPSAPDRYENVELLGRVLTLRSEKASLAAHPGRTLATAAKAPPSLDDISVTISRSVPDPFEDDAG